MNVQTKDQCTDCVQISYKRRLMERCTKLEQLCKEQRYCIARKGNCRYCPLWERDKEKQCRVLNPDRMEELGLEDSVFDHITTLEQLCRDMYACCSRDCFCPGGECKNGERMEHLGLLEGGQQ